MAEQAAPLSQPTAPLLLQSAGEVYYPERVDTAATGQAYLDQAKAYEDAMRAQGYLVRQSSTPTLDNAWMYAENKVPVADLYNLGYEFRTNADKLAKTKKNPTAQVWLNPSSTYALVNERGQDQVVAQGNDLAALDNIYNTARALSTEQGKKANWKLVETMADGTTRVMADDDPKSKLGGILDIALPLIGAALIPLTGGISGALGAAVGGAGGSALSGIAQGKSFGDILKNAAISGGLSYLGSSALGGLGGGSSGAVTGAGGTGSLVGSAAGDTLGNIAGKSLTDLVVQGAKATGQSVLSGAAGALGGAAGAAGGSALGDIVVKGAQNTAANIPGAVGAAGAIGALPGSSGSDIVVTGTPSPGINSVVPSLATVGGIGGAAALGSAAGGGGGGKADISDYLQAAALLSGLVGNAFGSGGKGGDKTMLPGATLDPIFTKQLPTVTADYTAREMPAQDWTRYAMQPEQSFFKHVPQRYMPPPLRMAEGGSVDREDFGVRPDGKRKGSGFLGVLRRPDGGVSTELSIGVEMDGEEVEIPTLVPSLTPEETDWLLTTPADEQAAKMPQSIVDKAVAHARQRMARGLSPFAEEEESPARKAKGGLAVGRGTGRSDEVDARLSDGEYVIDAETVALLGDGSNKAGAEALDSLRVNIRKQKGRNLAKGKFSVKARKPERYMRASK